MLTSIGKMPSAGAASPVQSRGVHVILFVLATIILACDSICIADAKTWVFVQNNTPYDLTVDTKQTGTPLGTDKWDQETQSIAAGQRMQVVSFNRDEGITRGKDFFFDTSLTWRSSSITLRQKVRGLVVNSHLWQSLKGGNFNDSWFDDRNTHTALWNAGGERIRVKYRAYFTGGDDNVEYILQKDYPTPADGNPSTLNILTYNVYLRPYLPWPLFNGQHTRAGILPRYLTGYDAVVFQEVFIEREKLLDGLKAEYPHSTRPLVDSSIPRGEGGVIIVSKWPIEAEDNHVFDACDGWDCLAAKGVVYARINKGGRKHHLFGAHLQAEDAKLQEEEKWQKRIKQIDEIVEFVSSKSIPATEPVIIAGDLNTDMKNAARYRQLRDALNASHPPVIGHQFSYDGPTNDLNDEDVRRAYDYVLFSRAHLQPINGQAEIRMLRPEEEWHEADTARWDLSDHYPMFASFSFQNLVFVDEQQHAPIDIIRLPASRAFSLVAFIVAVQNRGTAPIKIISYSFSGDSAFQTLSGHAEIPPGGNPYGFEATFAPESEGNFAADFVLHTDEANRTVIRISVKASAQGIAPAGLLDTSITPPQLRSGPQQITVNAVDRRTRIPVHGTVRIKIPGMPEVTGDTNVPFTLDLTQLPMAVTPGGIRVAHAPHARIVDLPPPYVETPVDLGPLPTTSLPGFPPR